MMTTTGLSRTALGVLALLAATGPACEGSEVRRPLDRDGFAETDDDADDVDDGEDDGQDGDDDGEVGPLSPELELWLIGAGGEELGREDDEVTLAADDEPEAYRDTIGFQIDLGIATIGVAADEAVRFFVDGGEVATTFLVVDDEGRGSATLEGVTLPERDEPVEVRVETVGIDGELLVASKRVLFEVEPCRIEAEIVADAAGCAELEADVLAPPFQAAHVLVSRLVGTCDRVSGTAHIGATDVTLAQVSFSDDGTARLVIPIDPNSRFSGDISVDVRASRSDDATTSSSAVAEGHLDLVRPTVAWVAPAPERAQLTLDDDDEDGDDDNGIQLDVRVAIGVEQGEGFTATLLVDGLPVAEREGEGPGEVSFGSVTFSEEGQTTLTVSVTDRCGNTIVAERELTVDPNPERIAIVVPADGAVLLAADDANRASREVYETTFTVDAERAEAGTRIVVSCQRAATVDPELWVDVGSVVVSAPSADGLYLVAVAADVGEVGQASRCVAAMDVPSALVSLPVRVTFAIPPPTLTIDEPASGACLVTDMVGLAGSAGGLEGRVLRLEGETPRGLVAVDPFATVADDRWSATYAVGDGEDGGYTFAVAAGDSFGNAVVSDAVSITVDRVAPALAFSAPSTTLDDAVTPDTDPAVPGYQTGVVITAGEATSLAGGEVCLAVNGQTPMCRALVASVTFSGVTLLAGDNLLRATGHDGCDNVADPVERTVHLTVQNPIAIVAPASGATLLASGDANPASTTTYELTVTVDADRAQVGSALSIECRPGGGEGFTTVGSRTVTTVAANGAYDVAVAVDTAALGTRVTCRARIDLPSASVSELVEWVLALPPPSLTLTSPTANQCFNGEAASIAAAGGASGLEGRAVTATLAATNGDATVTASGTADADSWSATLALGAALADGSYGVSASSTDAFGNPASTGTAVGVIVDKTDPVLTFVAPADPDIGEADDTSTAAGVQVDVVVRYQDARAGGQVCLVVGTAAPTCRSATATVTFADVTLQPGDNLLTVSATDACGNAAIPLELTRTLQLDAPTVVITTPPQDLTTAATTMDFVVRVTDDGAPLSGLVVRLLANGATTGITATGGGDGNYAFSAVPLPAGATTSFVAEAERPNAPVGVSAPRLVTQKSAKPTIGITQPADNAVFNLASAQCAGGGGDCMTSVSATTTNAEDGSAAQLAVVCDGVAASYNGTVVSNAVTFGSVTLQDNATCTLTPSVTDLFEQTVTGTAVTVTVDRTAPTIAITEPGATLEIPGDDADAGTAGLQHALSATLGGVAAGAVVTAELSWNDGSPNSKTLAHTVATTTPDGGSYVADFEEAGTPDLVTWPEGFVTVEISVSDAAGNSASATLVVSVGTEASIRITGPSVVPADACGAGCASGTVCADGLCWIAWGNGASRQLVTFVSSVQTTPDNVRVCSDDPSLAGNADVCASNASATGAFREVFRGDTSGGITLLDLSSALAPGPQRLVAEVLPTAGGDWVSSQAAASANERERRVFVDLTTPSITAVSSPSDTLDPIGTLSAAEQVSLPRVFEISFTTDEAGTARVYVNGVVAVTQSVAAGTTTVNVTLPEGTPQVWVVVTDAVGNASPANPGTGALVYQPTVDVTAPTLAFVRPAKSPLKLGDDLDVVLTSNAAGRTVTLFDDGVEVASQAVSGGGVTFAHADLGILSDGTHTLTASVSDAAGNATTVATTPASILVDTVPPSGTITAPADLSTLDTDADGAAPGFQVAVSFETGDGASTWTIASASGCDATFAGCQAPVVEASGAVTNPGGAEPPLAVTLDLGATISYQKIILTTADAAGNTHVTEVRVTIDVDCALAFLDLPASGWFNAARCVGQGGCASAQVSIGVGLVGSCGNVNRFYLYDGGVELASISNPSAVETFTVTFDDGESLLLEAKAFQGANEVVSTGVVPIDVDFQLPVVAFISTTIQGFVTAADGEEVDWGFSDDLDPETVGMQFHAAVQVSDTNADGGAITALTATAGATVDLVPGNVSIPVTLSGTSPITQSLLAMTLADAATHVVTVTATDAAGNADTSSFTATVDVTPPGVVTVTDLVVDRRRPRIELSWTAIASGDGLPEAYEIRYSKSAPILSENDWDEACDASLVFGSDPIPAPAPEGETMTAAIGGPDTRSFSDVCKLDVRFDDASSLSEVALYIVVRARDTGGNHSPLSEDSMVDVLNADLFNDESIVRFVNTGGVFGADATAPLITRRGALIGDITGDGRAEWAVFSPNTSGFCIMRGLASLPADATIDSLSGSDHVCLVGAGAGAIFAGVTQTGHHVAGLGDLNGDGLGDFGVSGRISNGSQTVAGEGYVAVYFGVAGTLPDLSSPNLRIRGISIGSGGAAFGSEYSGFCAAGDFDGAGDTPTGDLAIGETFDSVVHVIPGDDAWTSETDFSVDLSVAGTLTTLGAWSIATTGTWGVTEGNPSGSPPVFGFRCAPAGDVLPTPDGFGAGPRDDLLIHQNGSNDARMFLVPGRAFSAGDSVTVSEQPSAGVSDDTRSLRLRQESAGLRAGFGSSLQGVDLTNDGVPDVLVGHVLRRSASGGDGKTIHVFDGVGLAALVGQDVRISVSGDPVGDTLTGANGWIIVSELNTSIPYAVRAVGDFDGWLGSASGAPTIDLAFGDNAGDSVFLRLNQEDGAASIELGQLPVRDGEIVNRYRTAGTAGSIGTWVDGGADLDGDGLVDIISGSNLGEVLIIH